MKYDDKFNAMWEVMMERRAIQKKEEWFELSKIIKKSSKKDNVLEIGSLSGGTSYYFSKTFKNVVAIDMNKVDKLEENCTAIIGDSHSQEVVNKVRELGIKFDLIFIDGDHSYEGVKQDFLYYKEFLSEEGMIVFHDIISSDYHAGANCFVSLLWQEITKEYQFKEILYTGELKEKHKLAHWINSMDPGSWGGIGIIYLKKLLMTNDELPIEKPGIIV